MLSVLVVGALGAESAGAYLRSFSPLRFLAGLGLLQLRGVPPTFEGLPFPDVNGSLWTIAYEFRCYLAVPLLCALGLARRPRMWLGVTVVLTALSTQPALCSTSMTSRARCSSAPPRKRSGWPRSSWPVDASCCSAGVEGVYDVTPMGRNATELKVDLTLSVDLPLPSLSRHAVEPVMLSTMRATGQRFASTLYERLGLDPATVSVVEVQQR